MEHGELFSNHFYDFVTLAQNIACTDTSCTFGGRARYESQEASVCDIRIYHMIVTSS